MSNKERLARIQTLTRAINLLKKNPHTIPVVLEELREELRELLCALPAQS